MNISLIGWGTVALVAFCIRILVKKNKSYRRNYSLGLKVAEEIQSLIFKGAYKQAESLFENQTINEVTQITDHLALSLKVDKLQAWQDSENSDFSKLSLGVFYLHQAWIVRSHKLAEEISDGDRDVFYDYLKLSKGFLDGIPENAKCNAEVNSRRIRLYMSLSDNESASEYFKKVSKKYPDLVWPFLHYAELIQPKWGGSIDEVERFYENLPNDFLIKAISELKLIMDAILVDDNYFKKYNENLTDFAIQKMLEIDEKVVSKNLQSIHKYVLYNYMEALANNLNRKDIREKYLKLQNGHYTIYPYGLTQ